LYTVQDGRSTEAQYGLKLAISAGFPNDVIKSAEKIIRRLKSQHHHNHQRPSNHENDNETSENALYDIQIQVI